MRRSCPLLFYPHISVYVLTFPFLWVSFASRVCSSVQFRFTRVFFRAYTRTPKAVTYHEPFMNQQL